MYHTQIQELPREDHHPQQQRHEGPVPQQLGRGVPLVLQPHDEEEKKGIVNRREATST
jgi:hypothetical protein